MQGTSPQSYTAHPVEFRLTTDLIATALRRGLAEPLRLWVATRPTEEVPIEDQSGFFSTKALFRIRGTCARERGRVPGRKSLRRVLEADAGTFFEAVVLSKSQEGAWRRRGEAEVSILLLGPDHVIMEAHDYPWARLVGSRAGWRASLLSMLLTKVTTHARSQEELGRQVGCHRRTVIRRTKVSTSQGWCRVQKTWATVSGPISNGLPTGRHGRQGSEATSRATYVQNHTGRICKAHNVKGSWYLATRTCNEYHLIPHTSTLSPRSHLKRVRLRRSSLEMWPRALSLKDGPHDLSADKAGRNVDARARRKWVLQGVPLLPTARSLLLKETPYLTLVSGLRGWRLHTEFSWLEA